MNKLLKLTGVSMLAIITANGANAAGYTCEELIEYTSCNPGYYLSGSGCPDGYTFYSSICYAWGGEYYPNMTEEECLSWNEGEAADAEYMGAGCIDYNSSDGIGSNFVVASGITCEQCPIGSTCAGGTAGTTTCPAGSYCATAGLSQPTGKCNVGTYSIGGATSASCTSCPATGLTDKNGVAVVATTSGTGSTSASACFVGNNVEFKDDKGIWHYKNTCEHGNFQFGDCGWADHTGVMNEFGEYDYRCADGLELYWGAALSTPLCTPSFPETEEECNQVAGATWSEGAGECMCYDEMWNCNDGKLYCE